MFSKMNSKDECYSRNGSQFTVTSKYRINEMEIKLLSKEPVMSISNFLWLVVFSFHKGKPFWMLDQFWGLLKEANSRTRCFALRKRIEGIKQWMVEAAKPCHQAKRKQKAVIKNRKFNLVMWIIKISQS